jgi:hypothetical protein
MRCGTEKADETDFAAKMFVLLSFFQIELDDTADIIVCLINGELDFFTFFVSVLEDFRLLFLVQNDVNVNGAT